MTYVIPTNRNTIWAPGLLASGGIPNRTTINTTLSPLGIPTGGSGVTISIASPAVITMFGGAAAPANSTRIMFSTTGALPTGITAGYLYYVINRSGSTFQIANRIDFFADPLPIPINTSGSQSGVHTIILDDRPQIQAAVDACPSGQVVKLSADIFNVADFVLVPSNITVRGTRTSLLLQTTLSKPGGSIAQVRGTGDGPGPAFILGVNRFGNTEAGSVNLTSDATKGNNFCTVASTSSLSIGQIVLLDDLSAAGWQPDRTGLATSIWASPDYETVWKKHDPFASFSDDFSEANFPFMAGTNGDQYTRLDRPQCEMKEITGISGTTVTFSTVFHRTYRVSRTAQLTFFVSAFVKNSGIEDIRLKGFDDGATYFNAAAYCWQRDVEVVEWAGVGFDFVRAFRCEMFRCFVHDAAYPRPTGGAYAIGFDWGSADALVHNSISRMSNKVIVARGGAGKGCVVAYNYLDDAMIDFNSPANSAWVEVHANSSHFTGPSFTLFEGNWSPNADSDFTHGNSCYILHYRNWYTGFRSGFTNPDIIDQGGAFIDDLTQPNNGPKRCIGTQPYGQWHTAVGNVLGRPGQMSGWNYEGNAFPGPHCVWFLGWDSFPDPDIADPTKDHRYWRDGNKDFLTGIVTWHETPTGDHDLPPSLYLSARPGWWPPGLQWPLVDPLLQFGTQTQQDPPAKLRFDAGFPMMLDEDTGITPPAPATNKFAQNSVLIKPKRRRIGI